MAPVSVLSCPFWSPYPLCLTAIPAPRPQSNLLSRTVIQLACPSGGGLEPILCSSILTLACGFNENQLNMTRFKDYVKYLPGGTSIYNAQHWLQLLRGARRLGRPVFQSYSWGDDCPRRPPFFWWEPGTCNAWCVSERVAAGMWRKEGLECGTLMGLMEDRVFKTRSLELQVPEESHWCNQRRSAVRPSAVLAPSWSITSISAGCPQGVQGRRRAELRPL